MTISGSAVTGNTGSSTAGGVYVSGAGTINLTNSTIANNVSAVAGGLILESVVGTAHVSGCTITGNTTTAASTGLGGAISFSSATGTLALDNTIVSGNTADNGANDISVGGTGTVTSSYDAIGTANGFAYTPGPGDLPLGAALNLGPLGNWGGPTETIRLLAGSPAIDAGDPALTATTDQRGVGRPQGSGVDVGAYERVPGPDAILTAANVNAAGGTSYTVTVTYADTVAVAPATLGSGNVTVTGAPFAGGTVAPIVSFVGADISNPNRVVATYEFTPPGGAWSPADDGTYTVTMQPNQVADADGFSPAGTIGTFAVVAPLNLVVTNVNDSGPGSLRDAITRTSLVGGPNSNSVVFGNSTAGGAIDFYDGTPHTIDLLTALPSIADNLTLTGPGASLLTVRRSAAAVPTFRIFDITGASSQSVGLSGMTLTAGGDGDVAGAAVRNAGSNLTLTGVTVENNTSTSSGGGIYMSGAGVVNVVNCLVINNDSTLGGGDLGGGIYSAGAGSSTLRAAECPTTRPSKAAAFAWPAR